MRSLFRSALNPLGERKDSALATHIGQMVTEHTPPAPQTSMGKLLSYQLLVSSFFLTDIELATLRATQ